MSQEEQQFWKRMTFRQFAAVMVRLQAVWLFCCAAEVATYLPSYFQRLQGASSYLYVTPELRLSILMMVLRVLLYVAAAVALIQYTDRVLGWLVKDWIPKEPPQAI